MIWLRRWRATGARIVVLAIRDAERIADLHATGFARGWSAAEVEALMVQSGVIAVGARLGTTLLGMVLVRAVAGEAEILSVAVAPDWRGCGLARRLLEHAMDRAAALRARTMFLEVDAQNAPALAVYAHLGFKEVGRRRAYYQAEGGGDALVMRRELDDRRPFFAPPDAVEFDEEQG